MTISITKPTVGGDSGTWGTELNAALDALAAGAAPVSSAWVANTAVKQGQTLSNGGTLYSVNADMTTPSTFSTTGLTALGGSGSSVDQTARDAAAAAQSTATGNTTGLATKAPLLTPTALKTAAYTAVVNDLAMMNVAGGGTAVTLPAAPSDKAWVGVRSINATSGVPLTVTRGGSDTIGTAAATSVSVPADGEVTLYQYDAANTRWLAMANVKPMAFFDARSGVPSWAPAGLTKPFDNVRMVLGRGDDLLRVRSDMATVRAGTGKAHFLAIGDSQTSAYLGSGTNTVTQNWFALLKGLVVASGVPLCGTGFVKFTDAPDPTVDTRWTTTGTWTRNSGKHATASASGSTATLTPTAGDLPGNVGQHASIVYQHGGSATSNFTWQAFDNTGTAIGSAVTINTTTSGGYAVSTIDAAGIASIRITCATGATSVRLSTGRIWSDASGVEFSNLALYGSLVSAAFQGWADTSAASPSSWAYLMLPNPSAVVGTVGGNDALSGGTAAVLKPDLITLFNKWPTSTRVHLGNWQVYGYDVTVQASSFESVYYACADANPGWLHLDVASRMGSYANGVARGLLNTGDGHPRLPVHYDAARVMYGLITP